jgi:ElaB/YqjD/DUF883 family membrane-anchored ribosome-binding protein
MRDAFNSPEHTYLNGRMSTATTPSAGVHTRSMLSGEMHNLITDIEDLVKKATSLTGEELTAAKAKLSERLDAARVTFAEAGETVANKARNTATATNEYVHEQPWKAIGIGATLGLLLGFALVRR